jgi:hypothetical protein
VRTEEEHVLPKVTGCLGEPLDDWARKRMLALHDIHLQGSYAQQNPCEHICESQAEAARTFELSVEQILHLRGYAPVFRRRAKEVTHADA